MSDINEKETAVSSSPEAHHTVGETDHIAAPKPAGWMYTERKGLWYASPKIQLLLVALVCFLCSGMFNALSGLGGGGQVDPVPAANANVALYSTFSVVGFFAGTFANKLGIKLTLSFGGIGYAIYAASLLCYSHTSNSGFLIFAGAMLGVCAGLLWTAQGAIMMSYPEEKNKGKYISWFWMIFNLGAVIGSLIPLGQNIHVTNNSTVSDGTYIGFIVLMVLGAVLALLLCDAGKVIREDGSRVILMKNPTWKSEFLGLYESIQSDPYIILLFPMFFASNWFYVYQFNGMNGSHFTTRTKALNSTLYWTSQIIGAFVFGYFLDIQKIRRTLRAKLALVGLFVLTMVIWGGGLDWQLKQESRAVVSAKTYKGQMDWATSGYIGPMFLYMFYGFYDAAWQTCIYWFIGSLSNSGRKTANFAGFYKGIQSAGAAVIWRIDAIGTNYDAEFASSWALLGASLIIAAPVIFLKIQDHVSLEHDLEFSDETVEDILPGAKLNEKADV